MLSTFTLLLLQSGLGPSAVQVLVLFMGTDDIKKQTINSIYKQIEDKDRLNGLIVIVQSKMTAYARKELQNCPYKVEIIEVSYPIHECLIILFPCLCKNKYSSVGTHFVYGYFKNFFYNAYLVLALKE